MSNTGSAAPTRKFYAPLPVLVAPLPVLPGIPRFSKIGNEPIPVLDAAKMGNEKQNSIGNEPIPVLDAAKIGNPWFNP